MRLRAPLAAFGAALSFVASAPAHAGLIHMSYTGAVSGYFSLGILQDDFPVGTTVSMALTYDDSFIGLPTSQLYLGLAPSISGTMTLGGSTYTLDAMHLTYFSYGATSDDPSPNYGFHVTGTGPDTDDGEEFSGISLGFFGASLGAPNLIGFGNRNWFVADNGYLLLAGTTTHEQLGNPVSAPCSLALLLAALGACGATRPAARRAAQTARR